MKQSFYSNGKLLITGEYLVLDGGLALAVPTLYGQSLEVTPIDSGRLEWRSLDASNKLWFESEFDLNSLEELPVALRSELGNAQNNKIADRISRILTVVRRRNPAFLKDSRGCLVENTLTFPRDWGLGTSSTLINNIAQWAGVDPYELLWETFGGSGYDIACAQHQGPLLYQLENNKPQITEINFDPPFKSQLYFVYRNRKQDSGRAIRAYREQNLDKRSLVVRISDLSREISQSLTVAAFDSSITLHEELLSEMLQTPTVKSSHFPDYQGAIKSLGAWGGDFILATGGERTPAYFRNKGYSIVIPYSEMVLNK